MPRHPRLILAACIAIVSMLINPGVGSGQRAVFGRVVRTLSGAGGTVPLPYSVTDTTGNQWMIYPGGWLQMQGNNPMYSQGAMIQINGNQAAVRNNQARVDEKTGELIFENMNAAGFGVT